MAAAYIKVFCNGEPVRTFGGNKKEVRKMCEVYENMTVFDFVKKHPRFSEKLKSKKDIEVVFRKNR